MVVREKILEEFVGALMPREDKFVEVIILYIHMISLSLIQDPGCLDII